ncbi:hypothetical protein TWF281_004190 [Arthrobotrys megalospora]
MSKPNFNNLPAEIKTQIFSSLHPWELARLKRVCRHWNSLLTSLSPHYTKSPSLRVHWLLCYDFSCYTKCLTCKYKYKPTTYYKSFVKSLKGTFPAGSTPSPPTRFYDLWLQIRFSPNPTNNSNDFRIPHSILTQPAFIFTTGHGVPPKHLILSYSFSYKNKTVFARVSSIIPLDPTFSILGLMRQAWERMMEDTRGDMRMVRKVQFRIDTMGPEGLPVFEIAVTCGPR